jgi:hypothetical protein
MANLYRQSGQAADFAGLNPRRDLGHIFLGKEPLTTRGQTMEPATFRSRTDIKQEGGVTPPGVNEWR